VDPLPSSADSSVRGGPRGGAAPGAWFRELPCEKPAARRIDLDAARGLAILLVVLGHVVARDLPADNLWYVRVKHAIYLFHMPLFMALAGVSFALSLPRLVAWADVVRFSLKRIERLFVPYLAFGLIVIAGKLVAARYVAVDNPGGDSALVELFVRPTHSGVSFLWFIYVLSIYLVIVPALFQVVGRRPMLLLIAGVALGVIGWPELFMLDSVVAYLPFFAGGMLLWMYREVWARPSASLLWLTTLGFAALLAIAQCQEVPKWLVGAASLLPVLGWMHRLPAMLASGLAALGRASFAIYLMNTIAIGIAKGVLLLGMPWDGCNFLVFFPVLLLSGVAVPMMVRRAVMAHLPRVARYLA
jgi:fucose 4-O-acetylase-like acetyltransferase